LTLTEFYERVRPCGCVDLVAELSVEFLGQILEEGVGQLLVEVAIAESQKACVLFNDVAVRIRNIKNNLK
jgi:hypothetical protein